MKLEVMKLEVRNHEVRSSNELPGLPYCYGLFTGGKQMPHECCGRPYGFIGCQRAPVSEN